MVCHPFRTATLVDNETIEGQIGEGCRDAKGRTPLQLASAKAKGVKPLFQFPTLLGKFNLLSMVT